MVTNLHATAGKNEGISGLLEVTESRCFTNLHATAGMHEGITGLLEVPESGRFTALHSTADKNEGSTGLPEVPESGARMGGAGHESSLNLHATAEERSGNISLLEASEFDPVMGATAGEKGIIGSLEVTESDFSKNLAESTAIEVFAVTCHLMHVSHTLMRCLLLLLVHLLPLLLHVELHLFCCCWVGHA